MSNEYDFERFVKAQEPLIESVCEELRLGKKRGHWMWFVFPQVKGLGMSWAANFYGIGSHAEAAAYLAHPVLGPRLLECTALVNAVNGSTSQDIFGGIDSMKFRSSMTLFAEVAPGPSVFATALDKYFDGQADPLIMELLGPRERGATGS